MIKWFNIVREQKVAVIGPMVQEQGRIPKMRAGGQDPHLRSLDHLGRRSEALRYAK